MLNYLIILILSISTHVSAKETKFEKRLQKDIKKLSRISGFIDNNLKLYDEEEISDKKNTIVVIFNHGSFSCDAQRSVTVVDVNVAAHVMRDVAQGFVHLFRL